MISTRGAAVLSATALITLLSTPGIGQTTESYKVRLSTVPMDGGMRSTVAGRGSATATLAGSKLTIDGTFEGLLSPATTGKLHRGVAMGVSGSAFADLTVTKSSSGKISGSIDLTPEQLQGLKLKQLYIQISSEKAPDGNLWGWLVP
jgi:hypothetical protein